MNTPTFVVNGTWHRASSSPAHETQTITGTYPPFALPLVPQPLKIAPSRTTHGTTTEAIDEFFGVTRATRESRHDSYSSSVPPPPYVDAELPAYSADSNTEPITLAMYLFKFGFLFPPFWILGTIILISPLTAPTEFEPSKSETERQQLLQTIREAELRWARRCAWALFMLLVLAGVIAAIVVALLHSRALLRILLDLSPSIRFALIFQTPVPPVLFQLSFDVAKIVGD